MPSFNISDREEQIPNGFTDMWNLKSNQISKINQKQTHRYREQTDGCQRRGG